MLIVYHKPAESSSEKRIGAGTICAAVGITAQTVASENKDSPADRRGCVVPIMQKTLIAGNGTPANNQYPGKDQS